MSLTRKILIPVSIFIFISLSLEIIFSIFIKNDYKSMVKDTLFYLNKEYHTELDDIFWWPDNKIKVRFDELAQYESNEIDYEVKLVECAEIVDANKKKVFIVGGSAAFGFGVSNSKSFASLLNKKQEKFQFINTARPGWSSIHIKPLSKRLINQCEIDYIFFLLGNNEFLNFNLELQTSSNFNIMLMKNLVQHSNFLSYIYSARKSKNIDNHQRFNENLYHYEYNDWGTSTEINIINDLIDEKLLQLENNIEATVLYCLENNVTPVLSSIPINLYLQPNWAFRQPNDLSKEEIHFLKLAIYNKINLPEALNLIENYINNNLPSAVYYYFKAQILYSMEDYVNANAFFLQARDLMLGDLGKIMTINSVIEDVSKKYDLPHIDLNATFIEYFDKNPDVNLFIDDCHYSDVGHQIIANELISLFATIGNN